MNATNCSSDLILWMIQIGLKVDEESQNISLLTGFI